MRLKQYINEAMTDMEIVDIIKKNCMPFLKEYKSSNCNSILWRGSSKPVSYIDKKKTRLDGRNPKDTSEVLHSELNYEFKNVFGWKVRNGVFATANKYASEKYGKAYMFFPIGKYKYVWSDKVHDLYQKISGNEKFYNFIETDGYHNAGWDWRMEYGEDEKGHWEYNGKIVSSKLVPNIMDELDIMEPDEIEDNLLQWVPLVKYNDYLIKLEKKYDEKRDGFLYELINSYSNNRLDKAMKSLNEITFNCGYYYMVNENYEPVINEMLDNL
jgi:hypothetical protein